MKTVLKVLGIILALILLVVVVYFSYVLIAFHRLGDMELTPEGEATAKTAQRGLSPNTRRACLRWRDAFTTTLRMPKNW